MAEAWIADGTLALTVPNLDALSDDEGKPKQISSTVQEIGGLAWQLKVRKVLKPAGLNLYIYCNEEVKDHLWLCKVQLLVCSCEWQNNYKSLYGFNNHHWIVPINKNITSSMLEKGPWEIRVRVRVYQDLEKMKSLPPLETSLVVNMGEGCSETLLVNKHVLAGLSTYFRNLFFGDWSDKKKEQDGDYFKLYEAVDFDMDAFKLMIYSAMTMGWMVQESNCLNYERAIEVLKLAIKYDVPMLLDYCEKFLLTVKDQFKMDLLEVADQNGLIRLKEHYLDKISLLDYMDDLGRSREVHSRLRNVTQEQLQAKLDGKAKEVRKSTVHLKSVLEVFSRRSNIIWRLIKPFNELYMELMGEETKKDP